MVLSGIVQLQPIHVIALLLVLILTCTASHADQISTSLPGWTPSHILWEIKQRQYDRSFTQSLFNDLYSLKQIATTLLIYKTMRNLAPTQYAASMAAASSRVVDFYFDYQSSEDAHDLMIKTGLSNLDAVPGMTIPWMLRRGLSAMYSLRDSLYQLLPKPEFLFPVQPSLVYFKNPAINKLIKIAWVQASSARQYGGTLHDNGFFLIRPVVSPDACAITTTSRIEQTLANITCQVSQWRDIEIHLYPVHQQQENRLYIRFIMGDQASAFYQSPYDCGNSQVAFITDPAVAVEINTDLNGNTSASFLDINTPETITDTNTISEERFNPLQESTWVLIEDALTNFIAYPTTNNPEQSSEGEPIVLNASAGDYTTAVQQSPYLRQEGLTVMSSGNNSLIVVDNDTMDRSPVYCLVTDTNFGDVDLSQLDAIRLQRPDRSHLFRKLSMQILHQLAFEGLTQRYVTPALDLLFEYMLSADARKLFSDRSTNSQGTGQDQQYQFSDDDSSYEQSNSSQNGSSQSGSSQSDSSQSDSSQSDSSQSDSSQSDSSQSGSSQSGSGHGNDSSEDDTSDEERRSSSPISSTELEEMSETIKSMLRDKLMKRYWEGEQSLYLLTVLKCAGIDDPESVPRPAAKKEDNVQRNTSPAEAKPDPLETPSTSPKHLPHNSLTTNDKVTTSDEECGSSSPASSSPASSSPASSTESKKISKTAKNAMRDDFMRRYREGDQSPYLLAMLKLVGIDDPESVPGPGPTTRQRSNVQKSTSLAETKPDPMETSSINPKHLLQSTATEGSVITKPGTTSVTKLPAKTSRSETAIRSRTGRLIKRRKIYSPEPIAPKQKRPRKTDSPTETKLTQDKVGITTHSPTRNASDKRPATRKQTERITTRKGRLQYPCPVIDCTTAGPDKHPVYKSPNEWWQHVLDKHIYKAYLGTKEAGQISTGYKISGQQGDFFCPFPGCNALFESERTLSRHVRETPEHMAKIDQLPFNPFWKDLLFQVTDELKITTVNPLGTRTPAVFIEGQTYQCNSGACGNKPVNFIYNGDQPFLIDLLHHKDRYHDKETRKLGIRAGERLSVKPDTITKRLPSRNGQGWHCHDCEDSLQPAGATIGQCPEGLARHYEKEHFGREKNRDGKITVRCPFRNCNMADDGSRAVFHDLSDVYPHLRTHSSRIVRISRSELHGWLSESDIFPFIINPRRPPLIEAED